MYLASKAEIARTRLLLGDADTPTHLRSKEHFGACTYWHSSKPRLALYAAAGLLAFLFSGTPLAFMLLALPAGIEWSVFQKQKLQRLQNFESDYTALLLSLASGVRTGLDPLHALCQSCELFEAGTLMHQELRALKSAIENGVREEEAILRFGSLAAHPDVRLFRTAFLLARRQGGSLCECLQRLTKVTRQRQSFRRKIKSAVAMQKLSSLGIGACAVVIGVMQALSNPAALKETLDHPIGLKALGLGLFLIVFGMGWMMRMTRTRI